MRLESWSHPEWLTMGARGGRSYPDANWIGLDDRNSHRRNSDHGILYNIYIYNINNIDIVTSWAPVIQLVSSMQIPPVCG